MAFCALTHAGGIGIYIEVVGNDIDGYVAVCNICLGGCDVVGGAQRGHLHRTCGQQLHLTVGIAYKAFKGVAHTVGECAYYLGVGGSCEQAGVGLDSAAGRRGEAVFAFVECHAAQHNLFVEVVAFHFVDLFKVCVPVCVVLLLGRDEKRRVVHGGGGYPQLGESAFNAAHHTGDTVGRHGENFARLKVCEVEIVGRENTLPLLTFSAEF